VWNTHLKKRAAAGAGGGEQKKGGAKSKKKTARIDPPVPSASPSPSSSTTTATTNCSSADSAGEQSNTSKEEEEAELDKIEIPTLDLGFDFDMLLDAVPEPETHCLAVSAPVSPCSSASPPCVVDGHDDALLDLPEIDIVPELWSIMDGDGVAGACAEAVQSPWSNAAPCNGINGTEAGAATAEADDGKEWWLEDLERELGLWGPIEDYQYQPDPQGQSGLVDPPPASVDDPVSCYFEAGPVAGTPSTLESEASAALTDIIQMDL
jgi:myb proto-oncogene protein